MLSNCGDFNHVLVWSHSGQFMCVRLCICTDTQKNLFGEAIAEVMRNSLPLCPCVGGGWRWPGGGGESRRGRRHSAILSYRAGVEGVREGCREKGRPMDLHKATRRKSCVKRTLKFFSSQ